MHARNIVASHAEYRNYVIQHQTSTMNLSQHCLPLFRSVVDDSIRTAFVKRLRDQTPLDLVKFVALPVKPKASE